MRLSPGTLNPEQRQGRTRGWSSFSRRTVASLEDKQASAPEVFWGPPASCQLVPGSASALFHPVVSPTFVHQAPSFVEVSPICLLLRAIREPRPTLGRGPEQTPDGCGWPWRAPVASPHLWGQLEAAPHGQRGHARQPCLVGPQRRLETEAESDPRSPAAGQADSQTGALETLPAGPGVRGLLCPV